MLTASTTNPFFAEVVHGVEAQCFARGYSLLLCNTGEAEDRLLAYLRTLVAQRIDGLIVLTTNMCDSFFPHLARLPKMPVVAIDGRSDTPALSMVADDSLLGGRLAAEALLQTGRRRVGVVTGPLGHARCANRLRGFEARLAEAGLSVAFRAVGDLTVRGGYAAMGRLLRAAGQRPPEAVFCMNDLTAIGGLRALAERGLSVPGDVSLVGYDDIEMAEFATPPLTTIRQPTLAIGAKAATVLVDFIESGTRPADRYLLPPTLVRRRSVAPRRLAAPAAGDGAFARPRKGVS